MPKKRIFLLSLLLALLVLIVIYFQDLSYGLGQAKGQFHILWNAQPIEEVIASPNYADSIKSKLLLIQEIRRFAIDSLGINDSENYTTLFDQKGEAVLWTVNASPRYQIEPYEWCFPIAGCFPYKGYFNLEKTKAEAQRIKAMGYDVYVRPVSGWSTLGFFRDPILSNMLNESPGELAELIIHELTHATLFIRDSATYNENLATFVGEAGAVAFLNYRYGPEAEETRYYLGKQEDSRRFVDYLLRKMNALQRLYQSMPDSMPETDKAEAKKSWIGRVFVQLPLHTFNYPERYSWTTDSIYKINNAYFSQFVTYHSEENQFENEFYQLFQGDFKRYLAHLKSTYGK